MEAPRLQRWVSKPDSTEPQRGDTAGTPLFPCHDRQGMVLFETSSATGPIRLLFPEKSIIGIRDTGEGNSRRQDHGSAHAGPFLSGIKIDPLGSGVRYNWDEASRSDQRARNRPPREGKEQAIEALAERCDRDPESVIRDAIDAYLDLQGWQESHIREGLRQADAGNSPVTKKSPAFSPDGAPEAALDAPGDRGS